MRDGSQLKVVARRPNADDPQACRRQKQRGKTNQYSHIVITVGEREKPSFVSKKSRGAGHTRNSRVVAMSFQRRPTTPIRYSNAAPASGAAFGCRGRGKSPRPRREEPFVSSAGVRRSGEQCPDARGPPPSDYVQDAIKAGHAMKDVIKVGRRGACVDLVDHIQRRWNTSPVIKLHCSGKHANDMKRLADELEERTGGSVLFRSGGTIILHAPGCPM